MRFRLTPEQKEMILKEVMGSIKKDIQVNAFSKLVNYYDCGEYLEKDYETYEPMEGIDSFKKAWNEAFEVNMDDLVPLKELMKDIEEEMSNVIEGYIQCADQNGLSAYFTEGSIKKMMVSMEKRVNKSPLFAEALKSIKSEEDQALDALKRKAEALGYEVSLKKR